MKVPKKNASFFPKGKKQHANQPAQQVLSHTYNDSVPSNLIYEITIDFPKYRGKIVELKIRGRSQVYFSNSRKVPTASTTTLVQFDLNIVPYVVIVEIWQRKAGTYQKNTHVQVEATKGFCSVAVDSMNFIMEITIKRKGGTKHV